MDSQINDLNTRFASTKIKFCHAQGSCHYVNSLISYFIIKKSCLIFQISDKGRFVTAQADLQTGEEILRTRPYVHIVCHEYLDKLCHHCLHYINYALDPKLKKPEDQADDLSTLDDTIAALGAFAALSIDEPDPDVIMATEELRQAQPEALNLIQCEKCKLVRKETIC